KKSTALNQKAQKSSFLSKGPVKLDWKLESCIGTVEQLFREKSSSRCRSNLADAPCPFCAGHFISTPLCGARPAGYEPDNRTPRRT
ncbi:hypothetical protein JS562_51235, partial [Agrobacterium sp. S2]|nr:hypothetical protein [Agrobacterium sp. S2]